MAILITLTTQLFHDHITFTKNNHFVTILHQEKTTISMDIFYISKR